MFLLLLLLLKCTDGNQFKCCPLKEKKMFFLFQKHEIEINLLKFIDKREKQYRLCFVLWHFAYVFIHINCINVHIHIMSLIYHHSCKSFISGTSIMDTTYSGRKDFHKAITNVQDVFGMA